MVSLVNLNIPVFVEPVTTNFALGLLLLIPKFPDNGVIVFIKFKPVGYLFVKLLVITLVPVPESDMAVNKESSGAQHIDRHPLSTGFILIVQVIPSGLVITLLFATALVTDTATKSTSSADQQTENHKLSAELVLLAHKIPSGLVITLLPVPVDATATKRDNSADQHTDLQSLSDALVLLVQVIPSRLVITLFPVPDIETATNK